MEKGYNFTVRLLDGALFVVIKQLFDHVMSLKVLIDSFCHFSILKKKASFSTVLFRNIAMVNLSVEDGALLLSLNSCLIT